MTVFEYLSVFEALILGLAVARLLQGVVQTIRARARTRMYWVHLLWVAFFFVQLVHHWWGFWFNWSGPVHWTFYSYLFLLLQPVAFYVSADLFFPDFPEKDPVDLRRYYYENHRWLFGAVATAVGLRIVENVLLKSVPIWEVDPGLMGAFVGVLLPALLSQRWAHATLAIIAVSVQVVMFVVWKFF